MLRWAREDRLRNRRLPAQLVLAEDLSRHREILAALQQTGAHHDLRAQHGLVVVDVRGAVGAVVAVDGFAWRRKKRKRSVVSRMIEIREEDGGGDRCDLNDTTNTCSLG